MKKIAALDTIPRNEELKIADRAVALMSKASHLFVWSILEHQLTEFAFVCSHAFHTIQWHDQVEKSQSA